MSSGKVLNTRHISAMVVGNPLLWFATSIQFNLFGVKLVSIDIPSVNTGTIVYKMPFTYYM